MKQLRQVVILLLIIFGSPLLAQDDDVIRVKKPDTCGIDLFADPDLMDQSARLFLLRVIGIENKRESEKVMQHLPYSQLKRIMISMDSICRDTKEIKETKRFVLTAVKITRTDQPQVTDYPYVMVQLIYEPRKRE